MSLNLKYKKYDKNNQNIHASIWCIQNMIRMEKHENLHFIECYYPKYDKNGKIIKMYISFHLNHPKCDKNGKNDQNVNIFLFVISKMW